MVWCVRTEEGFEPVWTFFGQGGEVQFFTILCGCHFNQTMLLTAFRGFEAK